MNYRSRRLTGGMIKSPDRLQMDIFDSPSRFHVIRILITLFRENAAPRTLARQERGKNDSTRDLLRDTPSWAIKLWKQRY